MHRNPAFRPTPSEANFASARQREFGRASVDGVEWPLMGHVAVLLDAVGERAQIRLARCNAIARSDLPAKAVTAALGLEHGIARSMRQIKE